MKVWGVFERRAVEWTPYDTLIALKRTKEQATNLLDTLNKHRPWNGEFSEEWDKLMDKYPGINIEVSIREQYENMKPYVDKNPKPVELAKAALRKNGIEPVSTKIRGGTDGATFSTQDCGPSFLKRLGKRPKGFLCHGV